jgi:hypothetical protein
MGPSCRGSGIQSLGLGPPWPVSLAAAAACSRRVSTHSRPLCLSRVGSRAWLTICQGTRDGRAQPTGTFPEPMPVPWEKEGVQSHHLHGRKSSLGAHPRAVQLVGTRKIPHMDCSALRTLHVVPQQNETLPPRASHPPRNIPRAKDGMRWTLHIPKT